MSSKPATGLAVVQWRLECMAHSLLEKLAGLLPGPWVFRLGELLGGVVWHCLRLRRQAVLRNLRIAFAGEKELPELRRMAQATFRRTAANMLSAAHTARLSPAQLGEVIEVENIGLLEQALAGGRGVVLLLAHMGNWEVLSRLIHFFPAGSRAGAFYRPLNNRLMDRRILRRRQADGTRMFSKGDNPLQVAGFLREGGIVGILADQRVGRRGEPGMFFGRLTRCSPLPSLLARRAKSAVLALSLTTVRPGRWKVVFLPVAMPATTAQCMVGLEAAMKASPLDVFWMQERWKVYVNARQGLRDWLDQPAATGVKPHRVLWCPQHADDDGPPEAWRHPDARYEVLALEGLQALGTRALAAHISQLEDCQVLPFDCVLCPAAAPVGKQLDAACRRLGLRLYTVREVSSESPTSAQS